MIHLHFPSSSTKKRKLIAAAALVVVSGSISCTDPVNDDIIDAQGNETSGIPKNEFHRAGQRCTACHQPGGLAVAYTLAGTVFASAERQVGVGAVEIRLTDSDGTKFIAKTNCVGNFFITPAEWDPKFPILVDIARGNVRRSMRGPIGRASDCSQCHSLNIPPADPSQETGHIFLFGTDEPGAPGGAADCPVDPVRPGSP